MWVVVKIVVLIRVILGLCWGYMVIWEIMEENMETTIMGYMGGCQNYSPFWGTIIGIQKGTVILTTTHVGA